MLGSLEAFVGGGVAYQDERNTSFKGGVGSGGVVIAPANPNFTVDNYVTVDLRTGVRFGRYQLSMLRHESARRVRLPARDGEHDAGHGDDPETPHDRRSVQRGVLSPLCGSGAKA